MSTFEVVSQQFKIEGAVETIEVADKREDVFSPQYHGPRNIPISITLPATNKTYGDDSEKTPVFFVHFPIVQTARYAVYLDTNTEHVSCEMGYGGVNQKSRTGTPIPTTTNPSPLLGSELKQSVVSNQEIIFNNDDPQPIVIFLSNKTGKKIKVKYIVSLFEDDH